MKELEVEYFCPYGEECEKIKDDKIHRCVFYVELKGSNPQTGEKVNDWGCSISWLPVLLCENSKASRNTRDSVDEFKNEVRLVVNDFIKTFAIASQNRKELRDNDDNKDIKEIIINNKEEVDNK